MYRWAKMQYYLLPFILNLNFYWILEDIKDKDLQNAMGTES